jgi:hypothetical protein
LQEQRFPKSYCLAVFLEESFLEALANTIGAGQWRFLEDVGRRGKEASPSTRIADRIGNR